MPPRYTSRLILVLSAVMALGCLSSKSSAVEPLFSKYGTGTLLHPVEEPEKIAMPACYDRGPCHCRKDHVYIYTVNGLNPMCLGNFNGLCVYLKKQGFENTRFAQMYTYFGFADEIREVRKNDPEARIALVGFSLGANSVRDIANDLNRDGTRVDLLVYMVGDTIRNTPASRPPNVNRIVNIRAKGLVLTGGDFTMNGADIDGARNVKLECRHILTPSRKQTVELMMEELLMLACFPDQASGQVPSNQNAPPSGIQAAPLPSPFAPLRGPVKP